MLTTELLHAALDLFEKEKRRIDTHIAEIRAELKGQPGTEPVASSPIHGIKTPKPHKKMSVEARKRIQAAQRKRWAEYHKKQNSKTMAA